MSDVWSSSLNWVTRKKLAENHVKESSESMWHDVRAAIEDSCRSFNEIYGKEVGNSYSAAPNNDHRIRVTSSRQGKSETVDIDFSREAVTITATYHNRSGPKTYRMKADAETAFMVDESDQRLTPDEISENILSPMFFPDPSGSVYERRGLLSL